MFCGQRSRFCGLCGGGTSSLHRRKCFASELVAVERRQIHIVLRIVARIRRMLDRIDDPPAPAKLHRAQADEIHARLIDRAVALLDDQAFWPRQPRSPASARPTGPAPTINTGTNWTCLSHSWSGNSSGRNRCRDRQSYSVTKESATAVNYRADIDGDGRGHRNLSSLFVGRSGATIQDASQRGETPAAWRPCLRRRVELQRETARLALSNRGWGGREEWLHHRN